MSGFVKIHRTLLGHSAFRNEAEVMLFAWMVLRAAWRPTRVRYKGHAIDLERGQLAASIRDMAEAHDRHKNWISRVLNTMRVEDMIKTDAGTGVLVITICNYDEYQSSVEDRGTPNGTPARTDIGTHAGQRRDTEQIREEGKKEEKVAPPRGAAPYAFEGKIIRLNQADYDRWLKAFPNLDLAAQLQSRDDWLASEADPGAQKRWFITTSNWLAKRQQEASSGDQSEIAEFRRIAARRSPRESESIVDIVLRENREAVAR